ncbi:MAG TPA: SURF1 family protein [Kineosporiaceae bacterium]|nr:SURF1 family protein [Kineosporiaceae bacterium]
MSGTVQAQDAAPGPAAPARPGVRGVLAVLREPFWIRAALFAVLVSVVCGLLGRWQWGRHEGKVVVADRVHRNYDATPVPLAQVVPDPAAPLPADTQWRQVRVMGTYLADRTVLVRNRPLDVVYGYEVLVPLRPADGGPLLLVDRGWIPNGASGARPDAVPAPPAGTVTVVARLRPTEPPLDRQPPPGQELRIDVPRITASLGAPAVTRAYGVLASEDPWLAAAPTPLPRPDTDLGPHLSYAVQWWAGAVTAYVLLLVYAAKEAGRRRGGTAPAAPTARAARSRRRGLTDEEWEDLADAAAHPGRGEGVVAGGAVVHDHQAGTGAQRHVDQ